MSCNCNNIFPDEDLRRWETSCSVPYYTKAEIDEKLENIDISGDCMSSGDVQTQIDASVSPIEGSVEALSGSVGQLSTDMENKADRSEIPSLSGYATEQWVVNQGYLTEHQSLSGYATTADTAAVNDALSSHTSNNTIHVTATDKSNWNGKANVVELTQAEYDVLTDKDPDTIYIISDAPAMPPYEAGTGIAISGNVISCTVSGGGTIDLSQYWTSAETQNAIDDAISGITGITIDQNLDSGSTNAVANSAITQAINAKADASNVYTKSEVNNVVNNKFACMTQSEYDALVNKENGVLYLIYEI